MPKSKKPISNGEEESTKLLGKKKHTDVFSAGGASEPTTTAVMARRDALKRKESVARHARNRSQKGEGVARTAERFSRVLDSTLSDLDDTTVSRGYSSSLGSDRPTVSTLAATFNNNQSIFSPPPTRSHTGSLYPTTFFSAPLVWTQGNLGDLSLLPEEERARLLAEQEALLRRSGTSVGGSREEERARLLAEQEVLLRRSGTSVGGSREEERARLLAEQEALLRRSGTSVGGSREEERARLLAEQEALLRRSGTSVGGSREEERARLLAEQEVLLRRSGTSVGGSREEERARLLAEQEALLRRSGTSVGGSREEERARLLAEQEVLLRRSGTSVGGSREEERARLLAEQEALLRRSGTSVGGSREEERARLLAEQEVLLRRSGTSVGGSREEERARLLAEQEALLRRSGTSVGGSREEERARLLAEQEVLLRRSGTSVGGSREEERARLLAEQEALLRRSGTSVGGSREEERARLLAEQEVLLRRSGTSVGGSREEERARLLAEQEVLLRRSGTSVGGSREEERARLLAEQEALLRRSGTSVGGSREEERARLLAEQEALLRRSGTSVGGSREEERARLLAEQEVLLRRSGTSVGGSREEERARLLAEQEALLRRSGTSVGGSREEERARLLAEQEVLLRRSGTSVGGSREEERARLLAEQEALLRRSGTSVGGSREEERARLLAEQEALLRRSGTSVGGSREEERARLLAEQEALLRRSGTSVGGSREEERARLLAEQEVLLRRSGTSVGGSREEERARLLAEQEALLRRSGTSVGGSREEERARLLAEQEVLLRRSGTSVGGSREEERARLLAEQEALLRRSGTSVGGSREEERARLLAEQEVLLRRSGTSVGGSREEERARLLAEQEALLRRSGTSVGGSREEERARLLAEQEVLLRRSGTSVGGSREEERARLLAEQEALLRRSGTSVGGSREEERARLLAEQEAFKTQRVAVVGGILENAFITPAQRDGLNSGPVFLSALQQLKDQLTLGANENSAETAESFATRATTYASTTYEYFHNFHIQAEQKQLVENFNKLETFFSGRKLFYDAHGIDYVSFFNLRHTLYMLLSGTLDRSSIDQAKLLYAQAAEALARLESQATVKEDSLRRGKIGETDALLEDVSCKLRSARDNLDALDPKDESFADVKADVDQNVGKLEKLLLEQRGLLNDECNALRIRFLKYLRWMEPTDSSRLHNLVSALCTLTTTISTADFQSLKNIWIELKTANAELDRVVSEIQAKARDKFDLQWGGQSLTERLTPDSTYPEAKLEIFAIAPSSDPSSTFARFNTLAWFEENVPESTHVQIKHSENILVYDTKTRQQMNIVDKYLDTHAISTTSIRATPTIIMGVIGDNLGIATEIISDISRKKNISIREAKRLALEGDESRSMLPNQEVLECEQRSNEMLEKVMPGMRVRMTGGDIEKDMRFFHTHSYSSKSRHFFGPVANSVVEGFFYCSNSYLRQMSLSIPPSGGIFKGVTVSLEGIDGNRRAINLDGSKNYMEGMIKIAKSVHSDLSRPTDVSEIDAINTALVCAINNFAIQAVDLVNVATTPNPNTGGAANAMDDNNKIGFYVGQRQCAKQYVNNIRLLLENLSIIAKSINPYHADPSSSSSSAAGGNPAVQMRALTQIFGADTPLAIDELCKPNPDYKQLILRVNSLGFNAVLTKHSNLMPTQNNLNAAEAKNMQNVLTQTIAKPQLPPLLASPAA